jgi:C4-dicarboxylate transporter DctM subunit
MAAVLASARLRRHLRLVGGHRGHHHLGGAARDARHGYSGRLATGTLAAGGTLGILIPPSVPLVIYAILAEQNIAKLFAAAMMPGLIAMLGYMIAIAIYVRVVPGPGARARRRARRMRRALLGRAADRGDLPASCSAASTAACSRPPKARRWARRPPSWPRWPSARSPGPSSSHCFYATAEASAMIFLIFLGADLMNARWR